MYFRFVGIKEQEWEQHQLDLLIEGWDVSLVKDFLTYWRLVIISLEEYGQLPQLFWDIQVKLSFKEKPLTVILKGQSLKEPLHFFLSLGLMPQEVNFMSNPLPKEQVTSLIQTVAAEYKKISDAFEKEQQWLAQKEKKKFENKDVKAALKVINSNIDRIDQLLFIGKGVLSGEEMKKLTDISNELKKIRLGTNFNRMAQLLLDAQRYLSVAEAKVLKALDDKKFFIDRNSVVTNIDVISEYSALVMAQEKSVLKKPLTNWESVYLVGKSGTVFARFFWKDLVHSLSSLPVLLPNIISLLEYFTLVIIVVVIGLWIWMSLTGGLSPDGSALFSYLPVFGFLWLLLYIYNLYSLKRVGVQVVALLVLVFLYFWGISLLKSTFAL